MWVFLTELPTHNAKVWLSDRGFHPKFCNLFAAMLHNRDSVLFPSKNCHLVPNNSNLVSWEPLRRWPSMNHNHVVPVPVLLILIDITLRSLTSSSCVVLRLILTLRSLMMHEMRSWVVGWSHCAHSWCSCSPFQLYESCPDDVRHVFDPSHRGEVEDADEFRGLGIQSKCLSCCQLNFCCSCWLRTSASDYRSTKKNFSC